MNPLPAPPERLPPAGALETIVIRHSDPVQVSPDGGHGSYPLTFYRKRERLLPGAWVICGAGGRAELFWPGDASSLVLFDEGVAEIGEPARDEPLINLRSVSHARLMLTPEDQVRLTGGAILRGDPVQPSGPFVVERMRTGVLRVTNQSKRPAQVAYREATLDLAAGDTIDLPVLSTGTDPLERVRLEPRWTSGRVAVSLSGEAVLVEELGDPQRVHFEAVDHVEAQALGARVRLRPGEQAVFAGFGPARAPVLTAPPPPPPTPAPDAPEDPENEPPGR